MDDLPQFDKLGLLVWAEIIAVWFAFSHLCLLARWSAIHRQHYCFLEFSFDVVKISAF